MVRILLADDHNIVRKGLRGILEDYDGWHVCGEAANGREAVERALVLKPDVIVMDLAMPEMNGIEATREVKKVLPNTEVVILTMHDTEELIYCAYQAGARAFLLKSNDELELVRAIREIAAQRDPSALSSPTTSS
jgi:DNA-binding NarL/FixJ family response regulator